MCCLKYERDTYTSFKERAPRRGKTVRTPAGEGKVVELLPTRDLVTVDLGEGRRQTFALEELGIEAQGSGKTPEQAGREPEQAGREPEQAAREPGESEKEAAETGEGPRETGKEAANGRSDETPVSG
jgi:cell fate regulator YaaT (PSP1 superfamily)